MKNRFLILIIGLLIVSCSESRIKDFDELVLSESVYEEKGIYYQHAVNHKKVKYSGTCEFYHFKTGTLKGKAIIKNGLPNGHWEYWNENGSKRLDIYFENGEVIEKTTPNKTSLTNIDSSNMEDIVYQEYLGEHLKTIRQKLIPLSSTTQWTSIDKRKIETKNGNGAAVYYFLKEELQKIRFLQNTDTTDRFIEYYLDNDSLFFAFERQSDSVELKNDPEYYEPFEDSIFFKKGELIRIKSNMDCGVPFAEDYRKEEQGRLKTEFKQLFNRLKNE